MKPVDPFLQLKRHSTGRRSSAATDPRFSVQIGIRGPEAQAAVRAMVELGRRQKVGKRLGAEAVIKAERR